MRPRAARLAVRAVVGAAVVGRQHRRAAGRAEPARHDGQRVALVDLAARPGSRCNPPSWRRSRWSCCSRSCWARRGPGRRMHWSHRMRSLTGPDGRQVLVALVAIAIPVGLVLLQPDVGTIIVLAAMCAAVLVVAGVRARWLLGLAVAGAAVIVARDPARPAARLPARPIHGVREPGRRPARRRLQHRAGADRDRLRRPDRHRPVRRPADPRLVRARAGDRLHLHGGGRGARLRRGGLGDHAVRGACSGACCASARGRPTSRAGSSPPAWPGWFAFQAFQNIGMTLGIVPVTGLPLPFVSYGGFVDVRQHARGRSAPGRRHAHPADVHTGMITFASGFRASRALQPS